MNRPTLSLLGTALGDSLGLPSEGMSRSRIAKRWPQALAQRFLLGRGMVSDDTEHTVFVVQALLRCGDDPERFRRLLAGRLRWWFAMLPAGVGLATARACIRLWLGFPPTRSGVYSAGNGPAMRSPIIGVRFARDEERRRRFTEASTRLTHTDPRALEAALMVAEAAACAVAGENDRARVLERVGAWAGTAEWQPWLDHLADGLARGQSVSVFARECGWGEWVSGYAVHTVVMALFIWLRHRGDFKEAITQAIACGGDTDTLAAIIGGIAGAEAGTLPAPWLDRLADQPWSVAYLRRLGAALDAGGTPPTAAWWLIPLRNVIFFLAVLAHAFRRFLPPY